mgnify:CR=1 FL=1
METPNTPNKRGPKQGSTSFVMLSLDEITKLNDGNPIPVRRKWLEQAAVRQFVANKAETPNEQPEAPEQNSIITEEINLD